MIKTIKLDTISKRYAYALYLVAEQGKDLETIKNQMVELSTAISKVENWDKISQKPSFVNTTFSNKVLSALSKVKLAKDLKNFVSLLIRRKRSVFFTKIAEEFINIYNHKHRCEVLDVYCVDELGKTQQDLIKKFIKKQDSDIEDVQINEIIDKNLISGFKFMLDSKVYDSSLRVKLDNLKQTLR